MLSRCRTLQRKSGAVSGVLASRAFAQAKVHAVSHEPQEMTCSEAFVETLAAQKVENVFGIVGSAFMDALDLFPSAGIRFISVQHEQNAVHMADGYARVTGKHGVCIAQNGPGITNFYTGIAAAYWAHSPVVAITPEAGTMQKGLGGFQEIDQYTLFKECTKWIGHVPNPARMAEITSRCFDYSINERGPVQLNFFRDHLYTQNTYTIPKPKAPVRAEGASKSLKEAAAMIAKAKNPVILAGGGVVMSEGGFEAVKALAEKLQVPVANTYLHNDSFPRDHPLAVGPLGYQGHQSAMYCMQEADLVIALGTRLSPFGVNPQFGIDYWPKNAKVIQCDIDQRKIGLVKEVDCGIVGDAALAANSISQLLEGKTLASSANTKERLARMNEHKDTWEALLTSWSQDDPQHHEAGLMRPRAVLRALEKAMPSDAMISTDIGNINSVANSYIRCNQPNSMLGAMTFGNCGYSFPSAMGAKIAAPDRFAVAYVGDGAWGMSLNEVLTCVREDIPTTAVVFNNRQWGAEKKNQVLWFGDRYVGSNLENPWSYAEIARSMKAEGITCTHVDQIEGALKQAVQNQKEGKTTILEMMCTRELGDPFRRDAMKLPQRLLAKYKHTDEEAESATGQPVDLEDYKK